LGRKEEGEVKKTEFSYDSGKEKNHDLEKVPSDWEIVNGGL